MKADLGARTKPHEAGRTDEITPATIEPEAQQEDDLRLRDLDEVWRQRGLNSRRALSRHALDQYLTGIREADAADRVRGAQVAASEAQCGCAARSR